jgi:hypothetical protein
MRGVRSPGNKTYVNKKHVKGLSSKRVGGTLAWCGCCIIPRRSWYTSTCGPRRGNGVKRFRGVETGRNAFEAWRRGETLSRRGNGVKRFRGLETGRIAPWQTRPSPPPFPRTRRAREPSRGRARACPLVCGPEPMPMTGTLTRCVISRATSCGTHSTTCPRGAKGSGVSTLGETRLA